MTSVAAATPAALGSSQDSRDLDHRRPGSYPTLIIRIIHRLLGGAVRVVPVRKLALLLSEGQLLQGEHGSDQKQIRIRGNRQSTHTYDSEAEISAMLAIVRDPAK